jgi:hypothetical protein
MGIYSLDGCGFFREPVILDNDAFLARAIDDGAQAIDRHQGMSSRCRQDIRNWLGNARIFPALRVDARGIPKMRRFSLSHRERRTAPRLR